jgi:predicted transcriptional regulator
MSRKNWEFFKQQLSEIEKVAAETGEFKKVAEFLGISSVTLRTYRKKDKKLEQVILDGLSKYKPDTTCLCKYDYDFFEDKLGEIEEVVIKTGQITEVAKFLGMSKDTLRTYKNQLPELEKTINNALKKYRPFTPLQLKRIVEMNETGSKKDIAKFLGVSDPTLRAYYKKYPELKNLRRGHLPLLTEDKLTKSVLDKVQSIMKTGFKKDVIKFLGIKSTYTLRTYCKIYSELNTAIQSGINTRDKSFLFWKQSKLKTDYIEYNLKQFEEISAKTGQLKLVAKFFNINPGSLSQTMRMHPNLNTAIHRGLAKYKANKQEGKISKNHEESSEEQKPIELFRFKKAPKELVAKMDNIDRLDEADALARYRRMKEAEKEANILKQVKNIGEII